ncbi:hypothetical protein [Patiriisocius hiemis]|uniref:Lipoprotein n=1 Tax=Patiriisocius hiemis TaxID=3075604 RepID=A0ABU2YBB3_9FLAO|nr:hypothetical protein [Constantimarinum sp. W242]MDT0555471.1 hypothetical protein [Constantimarinum sp. W242]
MRLRKFWHILGALVLISCGKTSETQEQETVVQDNTTSFGARQYKLPSFSEAAQKQIQQWKAFEDFENGLTRFQKVGIEAIKNNSERLLITTDSITKTIPDTLNQSPIYARLLVAKTRVAMLHQEVRKSRVDSAQVEDQLKELYKATNDLVLQINEKFEREAIDVQRLEEEEKERQEQKRFLDSVYQAELKDQKN